MKTTIQLKKYRVVITKENGTSKTSHTNDFEFALKLQEKYKAFARKHNLTWTISLYGQGFLIETETINPSRIIVVN